METGHPEKGQIWIVESKEEGDRYVIWAAHINISVREKKLLAESNWEGGGGERATQRNKNDKTQTEKIKWVLVIANVKLYLNFPPATKTEYLEMDAGIEISLVIFKTERMKGNWDLACNFQNRGEKEGWG